jgi:hypothetical protein
VDQISQRDEPDYVQGLLSSGEDLKYFGEINPNGRNPAPAQPVVFLVPVFETCPDSQGGRETHFLRNNRLPDLVLFGAGTHLRPSSDYALYPASNSSVYSFYPASNYDLQRVAPHMKGRGRWPDDPRFWLEWELRAYP